MKFLPHFLFQKIEVFVALIHNFRINFKLCSGAENNFSIPPKSAKMQFSFSEAWN